MPPAYSMRALAYGRVMGLGKSLLSFLVFLLGQTLFALDMPSEWVFGTRPDDAPLVHSFTVKNTAWAAVTVSALASCECLSIGPSSFTLAPGKSMRVKLTFSPKGIQGAVKYAVLVTVRGGETADTILTVRGTIVSKEPKAPGEGCLRCRELEEEFRKAVAVTSELSVRYYFSGDCASCTRFIESEVPRLQKALGRKFVMVLLDIRTVDHLVEILETLEKKGIPLTAFPVIVIDDTVLQGEKEIREQFEAVMREKAGTPGM